MSDGGAVTSRSVRISVELDRRYRAAHGIPSDVPFTVGHGVKIIAWLGTPEGWAAYLEAAEAAQRTDGGPAPHPASPYPDED
jgi:hypothetical protein